MAAIVSFSEISLTKGNVMEYMRSLVLLLLLLPQLALAQIDVLEEDEELSLFFEEHELTEITSVSKKSQKLSDVPAAIFVITQEDIRRSGSITIPDLLRMVPGVQVARLDSNKWAVSVRGFNERFSNKLLVLMDGRSVYSPFFSGTYWDSQDVVFQDIERIEVIRGPGSTVWGANAVNGVINIITKNSQQSQGGLIDTGVGTEDNGFVSLRYGGYFSEEMTYRIYAKYFKRDTGTVDSDQGADDWHATRGGFRLDWQFSSKDMITLQGDLYDGTAGVHHGFGQAIPPTFLDEDDDTEIIGANVLFRWDRRFNEDSNFSLQSSVERTIRDEIFVREDRHTANVDMQFQTNLYDKHDIVVGVGGRYTMDEIINRNLWYMLPTERNDKLISAFIQDEISIIPDSLSVMLGSKFERNDYTGTEIQPGARVTWKPRDKHTAWASVSNAVRTPSRAEHDVRIYVAPQGALDDNDQPVLGLLTIEGDRDMDSEDLMAYELGYRFYPTKHMSVDIASFYNVYDNLRSVESGGKAVGYGHEPTPTAYLLPTHLENKLSGKTKGIELAANWQVLDSWRLQVAYNYLDMQLERDSDSTDETEVDDENDSPDHQASLRSWINVNKDVDFDGTLRYISKLKRTDVVERDIPSYLELDLRIAWRPVDKLELRLVGQNLLDAQHSEFTASTILTQATEVERSVYAKAEWMF